MSNLSENQEILLEEDNRHNLNSLSDIIQENSFILNNLSSISEGKFFERFELLCKQCWTIPKLNFMESKEKIIFKCKCSNDLGNELSIQEVFSNYLYDKFEDQDKNKLNLLKCDFHPNEKYFYYCKDCKNNICNKCRYEKENQYKCHHKNKIILYDDKNTTNKMKFRKIIQT